jgi:hypothetical protein
MYILANPGITPAQVRTALIGDRARPGSGFVDRPAGWNRERNYGSGILNMRRAIPGDFQIEIDSSPMPDRPPATAVPAKARVLIDGEPVIRDSVEMAVPAYIISERSYFWIRNLAYALKDTPARFSVTHIEEDDSVRIVRGENYVPRGNEMDNIETESVDAIPTRQSVFIDNVAINLQAYNIEGHNHFMLRELGMYLFFDVDWEEDEETRTILITTDRLAESGEGTAQDIDDSNVSELGILNGRFVRADGETGILAGYPWIEFHGNQITIPLAGGFGGVSVTSNYTFSGGNLTFQLEGVNVTWRLEINNADSFRLDFGVGIFIDFVREGTVPVETNRTVAIPNGRFVRADGMTGAMAGYPWIEFNGNQITIPLYGGIGGMSHTSNYNSRGENITFRLEGADVTWRVVVIDNGRITLDFGIGIDIEFVKE